MKTLQNLREVNSTTNTPVSIEVVTEAYDESDEVGNVLIALNHLASISDDLYSAIGDDEITLEADEIESILSAYDLLSEIHEKYESVLKSSDNEYDLDALDTEVYEEIQLQLEELELAEGAAWQMTVKTLKSLGFEMTKPGKDTYNSSKKIDHLFGIPMRAGKWADVFFVVFNDDNKPYGIVDAEGRTDFSELGQALSALKKRAKVQEETLEETPDRFGSSKAKLEASLDGFKKKLDSGKYPKYEADFKKMIANIQSQLDKMGPSKKESIDEGVISKEWVRAVNALGKAAAEKKTAEARYSKDNTENNKRVLDAATAKVAKVQARLADIKAKKESVEEGLELDEAAMIDMVSKACAKCDKGKYKDNAPDGYVRCDSCGDKAKRFQPEIPLSKTKGGKRVLSLMKKEDVSITKWNLNEGTDDQFRMEVIGQSGADVSSLIERILPSTEFVMYNEQFGFNTIEERDNTFAELVKFYETIKEWNITEIPLGNISEDFDESKFRRLAMTGLVADTDVAGIIRAMKALDAGKTLDVKQKNLIASTFQSLIGLVTGDVSVFSKIQGAVKKSSADAK